MPKGPFLASEFTPTQWSTTEDKAQFGNTLLHFIDNGWKETLFTKKFYNRLMNTFGHIAHFNLPGFYEEWFTNEVDRHRFLEHLLRWPCHGQPAFTFCDVERAVQQQLRARGYLELQNQRAAEEIRTAELQVLARLEQKHRGAPAEPNPSAVRAERLQAIPSSINPGSLPGDLPVQASLF